MTVVSRSIPGLFGGVSQKIPALRHPTQGAAQDNGIATVVDGLYKRAGTVHVATLPVTADGGLSVSNSGGDVTGHIVDRGEAGRHVLILKSGNLMLYDLKTGVAQAVTLPNGFGYLTATAPATAFRCLTVADTTFVVNTEVIPRMLPDTTPLNPTNVAYVNVRSVASKANYFVTVDGYQFSYTTGDTPKNADVANGLVDAINANGGGVLTAGRVADTNCIRITKNTGAISSASASDTWNNSGMQVTSNGVERYADLPTRFEAGFTVTIQGIEGTSAKYYVRWNGKGWEECPKPGVPYKFDPATMPHKLSPQAGGGWTFSQIDTWDNRLVGDDKTSPVPSFVDVGIQSVFFHRNRLGFLGGDAVVLSRAGDYYNFWPTSAQQVLDTDPIDLSAGADNVTELVWAVGFNQTLLLWSNAAQQFVLTSGDILSPKSARIMPTTSFAFKKEVRPVSIGNKAIFTAPYGEFTQANLYKVADDRLTNTADDITEDCPQYIPKGLTHLAASTTARTLIGTMHSWTNELYVWKWETDETGKLTQRAWSRYRLDRPEAVRVVCPFWVDRSLYLILCTPNQGTTGHHFTIERLDFGMPKDTFGANVPVLLDRAVKLTPSGAAGGYTTLEVPYPASTNLVALRIRGGGMEPEQFDPYAVTVVGPTASRVTIAGGFTDSFIVGNPFTFTYEFTEPFMQDRQGVPLMAANLKHVRTLVRYEGTGYFKATVAIPLRDTYTYEFVGRMVGQPNQEASFPALSSGTFSIPVQAKAAGVRVSLSSSSYLPCRFPFGEWVGDVTVKATR